LADSDFQAALRLVQDRALRRVGAALADAAAEAVATLRELLQPSEDPRVRLGAAKVLLDVTQRLADRDAEDRLAALEATIRVAELDQRQR
jgi:hypothetical protein